MFKMVRRKVPWILVFEAAMALRARWNTLPRDDRRRLTLLARKSKGNPMALTSDERREFRRIASGIDAMGLARDLAPFGRRLRGGRH
jgi:hypothetical protein